ncbi:MAG: S26 family signal peptidase, partial [Pseudomonadota bacterium]
DRICRSQTALYINGKFASHISHKQNALFNKAHKTGCYTLNSDEIIVLSSHENALDSRSFGILRKTDIISIVKPVIVLYH